MLGIVIGVLVLALSPAHAQSQFPATPAGRALEAWLKAFNNGDPESMNSFQERFDAQRATEFMTPMREKTGGFDLLSIERDEPQLVTFVVRERRSDGSRARGTLHLDETEPGMVAGFELFLIPDTAPTTQPRMDSAARAGIIGAVVARLNESYVFPDVARRIEQVLRQHVQNGKYDQVTDGGVFAGLLTSDLRQVSNDKHLQVRFATVPQSSSSTDATLQQRRLLEIMNCGFERVERLAGNVGYLKLNLFADPQFCAPTTSAAMQFIANTGAVIIDLRDNRGGDPEMVAYLSSHLFSAAVHLNDLWDRARNTTRQYWTAPYVPGPRLAEKPVYVLTSSRTFSAAEEFAYNLQMLKRASVIGETTGGGAHPVSGFRIDDRFMIVVPVARALNPVSGTNWEGIGVQPDVRCSAADALRTAETLASRKVQPR